MRDLSNVFVRSDLDDYAFDAATAQLNELAAAFTASDADERRRQRGRSFFTAARESDDPSEQSLFEDSPYSGPSSPISNNARFWVKDGEAHMLAILDSAAEGAHDRAHGGIVAGLFDELVGAVISSLNEPAFTVQLDISFRSGAPLHRPLEGTARISERNGRRIALEAEMHSGDRVVAEARALFLTVDAKQFGGPGRHG